MKKERLLLIILCFCFIFNLNKEAFATGKNEGGEKSPFMESFMKNMEVDLRLSYGFLNASPLRDGRLQNSLPNLRVIVAETYRQIRFLFRLGIRQ